MAIGALVAFDPVPGMEAELERRIVDVIKDVRTEPGNLLAVMLRDPNKPERLFEFAIYRDWAAVEAHRVADHSLVKGPSVRECFVGDMKPQYFETVDWPDAQKIN